MKKVCMGLGDPEWELRMVDAKSGANHEPALTHVVISGWQPESRTV
jgi:hypothetical protein